MRWIIGRKISMGACDRARKNDRLSALSAISLGHGELSLRILSCACLQAAQQRRNSAHTKLLLLLLL